MMPISAVVGSKDVLGVFDPGSHGSTFGGNPLASAVAIAAIDVLQEEKLVEKSFELGDYLMEKLKTIQNPIIKEIRGRGLFIGIELTEPARPYCEKLKENGLLCKETHLNVIRLAPPLIITEEELDWAFQKLYSVLNHAK